ncbi:hypothetical protein GAY31_20080 [Azospirillum brasilense]|nr:hypothetical protein [Azospirillum brasilense]
MATYGYVRVSTEEQVDGASLEHQRRQIAGLAMLAGLEEARVFEDVVSGSVPLSARDGGERLLAMLKPGDAVIVAKLDRMFRNAADALTRADEFQQRGIKLYLLDMGTEPVTQNGTSRMFFGMLALVAEFERGRIKERLNDGRTAKRARGGHTGGNRPFGYSVEGMGRDAVLVEIPEEQHAIKLMKLMRDQGKSLREIGAAMRDQGFKISHNGVARVLERA